MMEVRNKHNAVVGYCAPVATGVRYVQGHKPPRLPDVTRGMMWFPIQRRAFKVGERCEVGEWGVVRCWAVVELREGDDPTWLPGWRPVS